MGQLKKQTGHHFPWQRILTLVGVVAVIGLIGFVMGGRMNNGTKFQTSDGVTIAADVFEPEAKAAKGVLLLHMMPATRSSWKNFAEKLKSEGYLALAIDLRGHGESTKQGNQTLNYQTFDDPAHQATKEDVEAALSYLEKEFNLSKDKVGLVGASIGANLALEALADHPELKWAVLLSPGLDYRGIQTEPLIRQLKAGQQVYLVSSDDDLYSLETDRRLAKINPTATTVKEVSGVGHGTNMFDRLPALMDEVTSWIKNQG